MRTQFDEYRLSVILLAVTLIMAAVGAAFGYYAYDSAAALIVALPWLLVSLGFFSIRVAIRDDTIYVTYGLGIRMHQIPLTEVQSLEVVPNNYITWIYNPSLENVLRLKLRDGKTVTLGVGEPKRIMAVISSRMRG